MSEDTSPRAILIRVPRDLDKQIRHDAVEREKSLTGWFIEAAQDRLRKHETEPAD